MPTASLEAMLELWSTSLREAKDRIQPLFAAPRGARSASAFLDGLLGAERRKTGWIRAEAAGDPGPWCQQAVLGRSQLDADALRDVVREHVVEALAEPDALMVLNGTSFLKQGRASRGVHRQYTGSAGKITNCQIGVFGAYVSTKGMPSSTAPSACRRLGPTTRVAGLPRTSRRSWPSRPSRNWRSR